MNAKSHEKVYDASKRLQAKESERDSINENHKDTKKNNDDSDMSIEELSILIKRPDFSQYS